MDIAHYQIERTLGRKPFCRVYLAMDLRQKRRVVLRVFDPSLSEDVRFQRQFKSLYTKLGYATHANLLPLLDTGIDGGTYYTASEYLPYGHLKQQQAYISPKNSLQYVLKIADALSVLHDLGITHAGIRLSHLFFNQHGDVVLDGVDLAQQYFYQTHLSDNTAALPLADMPPELLTGKKISHRSDYYQLGLALYELFTGQHAFHPSKALTAYHTNGHIPQLPTELAYLQPLIDHLLAKAPLHRIATRTQLSTQVNQIAWPKAPHRYTPNKPLRWAAASLFAAACLPLSLSLQSAHSDSIASVVPQPVPMVAMTPVAAIAPVMRDQPQIAEQPVIAIQPVIPDEPLISALATLPTPDPIAPIPPTRQQQQHRLLAQAKQHIQAYRLTLPKGNNALASYHALYQLDPESADAAAVLYQISNQYHALAQRQFAAKAWDKSQQLTQKGLALVHNHRALLRLQNTLTQTLAAQALELAPKTANTTHIAQAIAQPEPTVTLTAAAQAPQSVRTPMTFEQPTATIERFTPATTVALKSPPEHPQRVRIFGTF